tara:strand:+ start:3188 stop:3811 length:624 start_codon:yes stop_codon:yes gene_type:complete
MLSSATLNTIAEQLHTAGWCAVDDALPKLAAHRLAAHAIALPDAVLHRAGVGRAAQRQTLDTLRRDTIVWLEPNNPADAPDQLWLGAMAQLQAHLNQHLFLGLKAYEAHYARYATGAFYGRHVDAFKGQSNRFISTVYYLNADWPSDANCGGELLLYGGLEHKQHPTHIAPMMGRLVVFLSEGTAHEVLPALRTRHSIAGWFRRGSS